MTTAKSNTIWLIDDDEVFQFIFKRQLLNCKSNSQLIIYPNGKKGFEDLSHNLSDPTKIPDIIFLDINMPILNGWKFLENFASIKSNLPKKVTIYLVTSSIDERDIEKARLFADIEEYLIKPISEDKIKTLLKENN